MLYPRMRMQQTEQDVIELFGGYDHRLRTGEGAWYDTKNLSSDHAPLLSTRRRRADTHRRARALLEKQALAYVGEDGTLYYNFLPTPVTGLSSGEKQLVGMGAYIVVFPDKVYLNTEDQTDHGSLEARCGPLSAEFEPCRFDGTVVSASYVQAQEPDAPENGAYWIDISGPVHALRQWSEARREWVAVESVYLRIRFTTLGVIPALFRVNDAVTLSGASESGLNGTKIIHALGGGENERDWILVDGLPETVSGEETALRLERLVPQMDFVCECRNRLWGCRYGVGEDGRVVNEILCCALGDFRNWQLFQGLSTDSWRASVGSDGPWTGAVNYLGSPIFFKENRIHRVSVSASGAHGVAETVCRGVQRGSEKSLVVVNETLFYKSPGGVCAWQGGFPQGVSAPLGAVVYHGAAAGEIGGKYYISMLDESDRPSLFVYDIERDLWLREDALHVTDFARAGGELYAVSDGELLALMGSTAVTGATREEDVAWEAVTGLQSFHLPENKRVSRYNIRLSLAAGASLSAALQYDSDGVWHSAGSVTASGAGTGKRKCPVPAPLACGTARAASRPAAPGRGTFSSPCGRTAATICSSSSPAAGRCACCRSRARWRREVITDEL